MQYRQELVILQSQGKKDKHMGKTKGMCKFRIIECNTFIKLEISLYLIWPAGQVRP